jgi:Calcineurin-like phosphoesterase
VTTLVVSDLHLGARAGADLLRRTPAREALEAALEGVERLVLLGDVVEMRERPAAQALADARPVLEALGTALGRDRSVLLVAGNHDHRLVAPWLARRRADRGALELEHRFSPHDASPAAEEIAGWLAPARVEVAYPGAWLAEDVYATHGHYLDRHVTTPALEPFALRASERLLARRRPLPGGVDGYEAVGAPVYRLVDKLAQGRRPGSATGGSPSHRAYRVLTGDDDSWSRRLLAGVVFPAAVALANRAGLGPIKADISGPELRRSALGAMGEVVRRLEVPAAHVVFGHTHRAGPLPGDDLDEWRAPGGARLHNAGTWIHEAYLVGDPPHESPYWAGGAVRVRDGEAPEHLRLLPGATARLLA